MRLVEQTYSSVSLYWSMKYFAAGVALYPAWLFLHCMGCPVRSHCVWEAVCTPTPATVPSTRRRILSLSLLLKSL